MDFFKSVTNTIAGYIVEPEQVPGFNPDVKPRAKGTRISDEPKKSKKKDVQPEQEKQEPVKEILDPYFGLLEIKDHIRPILDVDEELKKIELDTGIEGVLDASKLLDELNKKKGNGSDDSDDRDNDLMDFPDYGNGSDFNSDSDDDDDDVDDRGIYHHEVKNEKATEFSIFEGESHPISIRGDACVAETLTFKDASDWGHQFPVHKVQWFLGTEIGNEVSFGAFPKGETSAFVVPAEAVGRYIQVVATRRVEDHLKRRYVADVEGGVYDPHVQLAKHADIGIEKKYVDVHSTAIVGPVLISDGWSFTVMRALAEGEFRCAVKLRDEIIKADNAEYSDDENAYLHFRQQRYKTGGVLQRVPAALTINFSDVKFEYVLTKKNRHGLGKSTLFSLAWINNLFNYERKESLEKVPEECTAQMHLKKISFCLTDSEKTLILALEPRHRGFRHEKVVQDLIHFDVDPKIGKYVLFYIAIGFQAARKYRLKHHQIWEKHINQGDVEQGKELIQKYLEGEIFFEGRCVLIYCAILQISSDLLLPTFFQQIPGSVKIGFSDIFAISKL